MKRGLTHRPYKICSLGTSAARELVLARARPEERARREHAYGCQTFVVPPASTVRAPFLLALGGISTCCVGQRRHPPGGEGVGPPAPCLLWMARALFEHSGSERGVWCLPLGESSPRRATSRCSCTKRRVTAHRSRGGCAQNMGNADNFHDFPLARLAAN